MTQAEFQPTSEINSPDKEVFPYRKIISDFNLSVSHSSSLREISATKSEGRFPIQRHHAWDMTLVSIMSYSWAEVSQIIYN
jgi:hypothetical protein